MGDSYILRVELHTTALALGAEGKGLLAADESKGSIKKRLEKLKKENAEDNRREWRDVMFTAEGPFEKYISGKIICQHHQGTGDQTLGIKVDKGTVTLPRTVPEETTTEGLYGLLERCKQYYERGARFTAVFAVDFAGLVLKASMVVPGDMSGQKASPEQVAEAAVHVLSKTVPQPVPTIVFLSGGLSDSDSISFLNAINKRKQSNPPAALWALTFSFGRALQGVAMQAWADGKLKESQSMWVDQAKWSREAAAGKYESGCPS
ncbi:hypothetical protein AYO21_09303 [Fonsecaea monophora]|uniref:fructose-bisphosphate aldolase n=1 Tax=Fonsecaea monophora TaxID=254056 RepID=A0A177EY14_9EURO|nr:hypothetical protein AYO21_09303 [Fonsecaea monophora]OAG36496.1 hypothetical protein AYO21_09303 [Fonsecaea monophora]